MQFAFGIGITHDGLMPRPLDGTATVLSPPPSMHSMNVLRVYVTEPGVTDANIDLKNFELVPPSPLSLQSGRRVWVVATEEYAGPPPDPALGPRWRRSFTSSTTAQAKPKRLALSKWACGLGDYQLRMEGAAVRRLPPASLEAGVIARGNPADG
ncbi:MAG: hypothetical protein M3121_02905 [Chloroflexota bacterium]|nr:hypothetical protein [Chloroflexota bacterium]